MFESLSERLSSVLHAIGKRGQLTEDNIRDGLREVRLALLEADVNFNVVKKFIEHVKEKVVGQAIEKHLTPAQQFIKVFHEELVNLLGGKSTKLDVTHFPLSVIMLVGLQGSGKTTSTGKLASLLQSQGLRPYLVPVDIYRPAAIEQLQTLATQLNIPCFASNAAMKPLDIINAALHEAKEKEYTVVLLDTAGRLHIDEPLMQELTDIKLVAHPQEILFVADAMTGQDVVTVAEEFNKKLSLTGAILTKMDGDARGGAALSICSSTGVPVKYVGTGEKLSDFEVFHPDRIAGRILGMGDMLTLIEKAQSTFEDDELKAITEKIQKATFNFEDFFSQLRRMKQLGSLSSLMKLIPGFGSAVSKFRVAIPEDEFSYTEAIINSMTIKERRNPDLLNTSRRQRIARGAGVTLNKVNQTIQKFDQMKQMMQRVVSDNSLMKNAESGEGGFGLGSFFGEGGIGFSALPGIPGLFGRPVLRSTSIGGVNGSGKSATKKKKEKKKHKNKKRK